MKDQFVIKGTQETLPEGEEEVIEVEPCKKKKKELEHRNQSKGKLKIFDFAYLLKVPWETSMRTKNLVRRYQYK